ncbi:MAG TPA: DUF58 domain-containing protein [Planctomycetota bacterium]|nr:DUF58 domain-containing protein [Planctomycetota bacterium]
MSLLDPGLARQLEQLELVVRRLNSSRTQGEKRSKRRGAGTDFADYRDYVQGDDPRFIDWNVYGRLDRLFLKLFHEEEDLRVTIYLDTSRSMGFGDPEKLLYAKRAAVCVAYVALCAMDRVVIEGGPSPMRPARGKRQLRTVIDYLEPLEAKGGTDLAEGLRGMMMRSRAAGLKVVVSDFLDKRGYEGALKWLLRPEDRAVVVQVLSPQEIHPDIVGDLALQDSEDGELTEVSITAGLLKQYRQALGTLVGGLRAWCRTRGVAYVFADTSVPVEQAVVSALRASGVMR